MQRRVQAMSEEPRDNDAWVSHLAADGPTGDCARRDLRALLVRSLKRALRSRGVPDDLCEDFAQEALVRVREGLGAFRGDCSFTTWALAIATRLAFDDLRHKRWKDVSFEAITEDARGSVEFEQSTEGSPERTLMRDRVFAALRRVIDQELTEKQRTVLNARLRGMPPAEIAAQLGMNRGALYKLAHDARKRVKARLEAAGISEADVLWAFEVRR
jgi:RNA polymerase sigma-70 factor (ECF subfamily)